MKIVITGGSGMVGRNISEHPQARDVELLTPSRSDVDLLNETAVVSYLSAVKPDVVIHVAGTVGGIQANINAPVRFLSENLKVGMNVILGARQANITKLLNVGSSCMYPRAAENPLREETILTGELEPTNEGYALAKIACARLCSYINIEDAGFSYKTIIPCNLYGRHDKFDPRHSHMIPAVVRKIYEAKQIGAETVDIWGNGTARREFMYAGDLADFIFFALERFGALPQDLNVGIGHDHSINDYYREIADVVGFGGGFTHDLSKPAGMNQKLVDIHGIEGLGWRAKTDLPDGIRATLDYFVKEVTK